MDKLQHFHQIIIEMTTDLNHTFPEYHHLLSKWNNENMEMEEISSLYEYSLSVYPERFFDILYQNNDIFTMESKVNTFFLPDINFQYFFHCEGVSDNTKQFIWNYLKTILIILVNDTNDKSIFGETSSDFVDVDEKGLFEKLKETMVDISSFLEKKQSEKTSTSEPEPSTTEPSSPSTEPSATEPSNLPNANDFFSHIGDLFEGKVGCFAKELAEEFTQEIQGIIGDENIHNMKSPSDIMKTLFKDPAKFSSLMKTVAEKFKGKMDSGEFTKEDLTKETSDIMNKMKSAGNMDYGDIMKYVSQMMKPPTSSTSSSHSSSSNSSSQNNPFQTTREKLKNRMELKRALNLEKEALLQKQKEEAEKNFVEYNFTLDTDNEKQPTTSFSKKQKNKKK